MKKVKVLGTGCAKCNMLYEAVNEVIQANSLDCDLQKVEDIREIVALGILTTPSLVVDGDVKSTGKVPSAVEILEMLQ